MAVTEQWHNMVTASIGGAENYGVGVSPNPWAEKMDCYARRIKTAGIREAISDKIVMLAEPRFITATETSELMEALITMIGATQILELGCHTGRSTLHFLRAIVGIDGARVVSIDARPTHDREFFAKPGIALHFEFLSGWTPPILEQLKGRVFDFVFVDSAHDLDHTQKEWAALQPITRSGTMFCWHDMPEWQSPSHHAKPPVRLWLEQQIAEGKMRGLILPSPRQLDCAEEFGEGYDNRLNPGLAITIRT